MHLPTLSRRRMLGATLGTSAGSLLPGCKPPTDIGHIGGGFLGTSPERGHLVRALAATARATILAPARTHRTRVLILGGGVAGLAAARALRLQGIDDIALLELEDSAGGNARGTALAGIACPLGAHYLPVPSDHAPDVQDLLEELGLRKRLAGRWVYDERHLCHSPQERLYFQGQWQDGLLPLAGVGAATLDQYRRFAAIVNQEQRASAWALPVRKGRYQPLAPTQQALAAITFEAYLDRHRLDDAHLRWYLNYCCRDDYGAGLGTVSAWAGVHYFASRHGFRAPGSEPAESAGVLTWPEGNGWLTQRLAVPLGERLHTAQVVLRIEQGRHGVAVHSFNAAAQQTERWLAERVVVALPVFVSARVVQQPPDFLRDAAARLCHAPWLVANIHMRGPLQGAAGAAPSWDNVVHGVSQPGSGGLGYVNATHQSLLPVPGATVLTYYRALGDAPGGASVARRQLLEQPWSHWRDDIVQELSVAHPDMAEKATRLEVTRYGHAMAMPLPDVQGRVGFAHAPAGRLHFAHSDWAGYSVFEEAFTAGHAAGYALGKVLRA